MFEVVTLNSENAETSRIVVRNVSDARFYAKGLLYTEGTVKVLILKDGEKFDAYQLGKFGKPELLIF